jgi:hypothetical protein
MDASNRIEEALLTLAWSLWTELGVAGVERHHQDCAVDPEALLLFTATLADRDRRLRDESLDCTLAIAPYLFVSRLKVLLRVATPAAQTRFDPLAATFNELTKTYVRFPKTQSASPWKPDLSGKSARGAFDRPGQIMLRCRSIFGVAARADIVTAMVCNRRSGWTASELAERTSLAKRVVANVLQDLERGGVLRATAIGNRLRYDVVAPKWLEGLVGVTPARMPVWSSVLPFMAAAASLVDHATERSETALLVDAQKLVTDFLEGQARLGRVWDGPAFESWPDVSRWLAEEVERVATGRSSWLGDQAVGGPKSSPT